MSSLSHPAEETPPRPPDLPVREEYIPWASCVQALRLKVDERHWLDVSFALPGQTRAFVLLLETHQEALQNQALAQALTARGFGTLTASLLTPEEHTDAEELAWHVNDLGERAATVLEWLEHQPFRGALPLAAVGWRRSAPRADRPDPAPDVFRHRRQTEPRCMAAHRCRETLGTPASSDARRALAGGDRAHLRVVRTPSADHALVPGGSGGLESPFRPDPLPLIPE